MFSSPLVILLDLDGTVIGNITPQVIMYEIFSKLKGQLRLPPIFAKALQKKLANGIVRPHFKQFMKDLQTEGVEIFIYTASEKKWAEFLIKQIEIALDIKINRPIFTRANCQLVNGEYMKCFKRVMPAVVRTLRKKYPNLREKDLKNMVMAVDNNQVYMNPDKKNVLVCETYNYAVPENIPAFITEDIFDAHKDLIMKVLTMYYPQIRYTSTYMKFEKQYYFYYIDSLTTLLKNKSSFMNDHFFKTLKTYIIQKKISIFNESTVSYLHSKLKDARSSFY